MSKTRSKNLLPNKICVCRECGSEDVLLNAYVVWDKKTQKFEVSEVFSEWAFCNQCYGGTNVDWCAE